MASLGRACAGACAPAPAQPRRDVLTLAHVLPAPAGLLHVRTVCVVVTTPFFVTERESVVVRVVHALPALEVTHTRTVVLLLALPLVLLHALLVVVVLRAPVVALTLRVVHVVTLSAALAVGALASTPALVSASEAMSSAMRRIVSSGVCGAVCVHTSCAC